MRTAEIDIFDAKLKDTAVKIYNLSSEHIEELAAAYLKKTNIPPDECELVVEFRNTEIIYYFRKRK